MADFTFRVVAARHPNAIGVDDGSVAGREIGFRVTATLTRTDGQVLTGLQERYVLTQYVKDSYWFRTRTDENAPWVDGGLEGSGNQWIKDEFGWDDALGEWQTSPTWTRFDDEPGFLGNGRRGTALPENAELGVYEISFRWTLRDRLSHVAATAIGLSLTLVADPDDQNQLTYGWRRPNATLGSLPFDRSVQLTL